MVYRLACSSTGIDTAVIAIPAVVFVTDLFTTGDQFAQVDKLIVTAI